MERLREVDNVTAVSMQAERVRGHRHNRAILRRDGPCTHRRERLRDRPLRRFDQGVRRRSRRQRPIRPVVAVRKNFLRDPQSRFPRCTDRSRTRETEENQPGIARAHRRGHDPGDRGLARGKRVEATMRFHVPHLRDGLKRRDLRHDETIDVVLVQPELTTSKMLTVRKPRMRPDRHAGDLSQGHRPSHRLEIARVRSTRNVRRTDPGHESLVMPRSLPEIAVEINREHDERVFPPDRFATLNEPGSSVIDVNGLRLDLLFIDQGGQKRDWFSIVKE